MFQWLWRLFGKGRRTRVHNEPRFGDRVAEAPATPAGIAERPASAGAPAPTRAGSSLTPSPPPDWLRKLPGKVAILDVETTGLHSADRIVSLAVIRLDTPALAHDKINLRLTHLIFDPGKKCHPEAARVHGHDEWTLRHQPFFSEHAADVREMLEEADVVVAHNAAFDLSFVNRELEAASLPPLTRSAFCTMQTYRARFAARASLNAVAARVGMARSGQRHGALEDAWLTMNVFLWLHDCPRRYDFEACPERGFRNFQPVPAMPAGELPPRKRRPRRKSAPRTERTGVKATSADPGCLVSPHSTLTETEAAGVAE